MNLARTAYLALLAGCTSVPSMPDVVTAPASPAPPPDVVTCLEAGDVTSCFPEGAEEIVITTGGAFGHPRVVELPRPGEPLRVFCPMSGATNYGASGETVLSCDAAGTITILVRLHRPKTRQSPLYIDAGVIFLDGVPRTLLVEDVAGERFTKATGLLLNADDLTFPTNRRVMRGTSHPDGQIACLHEHLERGDLGRFGSCEVPGWMIFEVPRDATAAGVTFATLGASPLPCDGEIREVDDGLLYCSDGLGVYWLTNNMQYHQLYTLQTTEHRFVTQEEPEPEFDPTRFPRTPYARGTVTYQIGSTRHDIEMVYRHGDYELRALIARPILNAR